MDKKERDKLVDEYIAICHGDLLPPALLFSNQKFKIPEDKLCIYVGKPRWNGPMPGEGYSWRRVKTLPLETPQEEVEKAIDKILMNPRYFSVCRSCNRRTNAGYMFSDALCQTCGSKELGITY